MHSPLPRHTGAHISRCLLLSFSLSPLELAIGAEQQTTVLPEVQIVGAPVESDLGYGARQVSSASKGSVPIREEAQTVNVVTPQVIDDFAVQSLDDAMKFVSGVSQSNTLGNTKDAFIKRGFGTNADGSFLRDGIRSSLSRNFSATTERVEVLKGPASLLYGALDPGGLINVISKQPRYSQSTTLGGSLYSEDGGSVSIDTTGPLGDSGFAYRLIAERQHEDYWRNYGADEHSLVAPSLSWVGERASLTLAYEYNDYSSPFDRGTVFVDGHPADVDYDKRLDETWAKAVGISETAMARFEYELNDSWKTRLIYGWNNDRYGLSIAQPISLSASGQLTRAANGAHYDYETRYASWDFIGRAELLGQRHDLLVGVDNELSDQYRGKTYRNPNATRRAIDIYEPVQGDLTPPSVVSAAQSNQRSELQSTSFYVKDNWHLDERWILVLGGRYQTYEQYAAQGVGANHKVNLDKRDHTSVPFAGLVYEVNDALSLYGSYSRSFVPNTSMDDAGNTFDPEQGRSVEIGAKYEVASGLSANLALFDIKKDNVVTSTTVGGVTVSDAAGTVGSRGLELDITGRLAERWDLIGTYAYTRTEILDDPEDEGNRLTQAPEHTASLYLTHHLRVPSGLGQWHAGGGARYVGERAGNNANDYWMSSYTVADAFLRWEYPLLGQKVRLQLNVDNLFDKHYYPSSTGSQLQVNVGEPRTARLSASVTF